MKYKMALRHGKLVLSAVLFIGLSVGVLRAQAVNPNALKAFQASSGGAAATWNAGPNNSWEATWAREGQKMVYCYDQAGQLQQKKNISNVSTFPANVNTAIKAAYPQGNIQYAYKVIDRSNQKYYEVQVANGATVERMRYSLEGKPVGKTSLAVSQPVNTQPIASAAVTPKPATNPVKPAVVATPTPAKPTPATPVVATKPNPTTIAATPSTVKPAPQPMAMRGEAASSTATAKNADLMDDDLGDLLEDEGDMDDLFNDDENWDDINLDDDLEDDSDLLDGTDDLDVDDSLDLDDLDDDDGI